MKLVVTGATGLIGSRFLELMHEDHDIAPLSSSGGVDITKKSSIEDFFKDVDAEALIHFAAKTNVDGCEEDKQEDLKLLGVSSFDEIDVLKVDPKIWEGGKSAFAINAIGTRNLYEVAKAQGLKFLYISTDFVFSGNDEYYDEESKIDPVDWYGATKYLGETVLGEDDIISRISFPYGYKSPVKKDLVWGLYDLLQSRDEVSIIGNQIITPTFIDDVVNGVIFLLNKNAKGIYHLTGSSFLSPLEVAQKIKERAGLKVSISQSKLEDVYKDRAPRPFKAKVKNGKLTNLGFKPKTFDEGLSLVLDA